MFKANMINCQQARALLRAKIAEHGEGHPDAVVFLHACGNLYFLKEDSDFRKDFTNKNPDGSEPPSAYRLIFRRIEDIPKSQEALENSFFSAKARETKERAIPKSVSKIPTLMVTDEDLLPHELEAKRAKEAEVAVKQKNKGGRPRKDQTVEPAQVGGDNGGIDIGGPEGGIKIRVDETDKF